MTETAVGPALEEARPRAMGALLRALRDLDAAEDAFQTACLRALKTWPERGLPADPAAWLIVAGRNAAIDAARRLQKQQPLPDEAVLSDLDDHEARLAETMDAARYPDDVLRLLFVCCHPDLPPAHQIALALRVVCGVSTARIARAFLVGERAMEQRLTRAKARIAEAGVPFAPPAPAERAERLGAVLGMLYLLFNEGYSAPDPAAAAAKASLCDEALRLARLLIGLFPDDAELAGLTALMLLQHARTAARTDSAGGLVLLEAQDRARWDRAMIAEGIALVTQGLRTADGAPGTYLLQAAVAAEHARAARPADTDWRAIERLYALMERVQPSPVVTLNRAVAVAKVSGPAAALALIEPLAERLADYLHFHGARAALLVDLGRRDEARASLLRALDLADTPAVADYLRHRLASLDPAAVAG
ncbi:RNA polymerase sigma factor [Caenispirillum bisanense]|uniref:RNA polymerase, sigma subunit, ECF family n=1 Tax=Caenispirillum bisanense TaxID=414052 RepID=A0A286GZ67_9PROT|nr:DUF6596 domain-containing protein [Caenispirillum bisanense]SOE00820.1 RNA polymerase, sigma subunit, ECF family [Caenispirillum bisanense]